VSCWICEKVVKPFKKVLHKTPPFKILAKGSGGNVALPPLVLPSSGSKGWERFFSPSQLSIWIAPLAYNYYITKLSNFLVSGLVLIRLFFLK